MQPTPNIWSFLKELVLRFGAKNPAIFNVLAWVGAIATFLTGLPLFSAQLEAVGIVLPDAWEAIQSKVVFFCGIVVTLMSNLPMKAVPIAPAAEILPDAKPGDIVAVQKVDKTPFTSAVLAKEIKANEEAEKVPPLNKGVPPID